MYDCRTHVLFDSNSSTTEKISLIRTLSESLTSRYNNSIISLKVKNESLVEPKGEISLFNGLRQCLSCFESSRSIFPKEIYIILGSSNTNDCSDINLMINEIADKSISVSLLSMNGEWRLFHLMQRMINMKIICSNSSNKVTHYIEVD